MLRILRMAVLVGLATTLPVSALAAGNDVVEPSGDPAVQAYNKGVQLTLKKKFDKAEKWFRRALADNEEFAEAHNNLGYVLRKQGDEKYEEALVHYDRAIDLSPTLPEPYMYRGVLHVQMGNVSLADGDYEALQALSPRLADELAYVLKNKREKEPEHFFGVSGEFD